MPTNQTTARPIATPGIAVSAVETSVSPSPLPLAISTIAPKTTAPIVGAEEGADDALPEALGQEDGEVPERDPHREPDEQGHQRFLPCLRRCLRRSRRFSSRSRRATSAGSTAGGSPLLDGEPPLSLSTAGSTVATAPAFGRGSALGGDLVLQLGVAPLAVVFEPGQLDLVGERRARCPRRRRSARGGGRSPARVPSRRSAPARR